MQFLQLPFLCSWSKIPCYLSQGIGLAGGQEVSSYLRMFFGKTVPTLTFLNAKQPVIFNPFAAGRGAGFASRGLNNPIGNTSRLSGTVRNDLVYPLDGNCMVWGSCPICFNGMGGRLLRCAPNGGWLQRSSPLSSPPGLRVSFCQPPIIFPNRLQ